MNTQMPIWIEVGSPSRQKKRQVDDGGVGLPKQSFHAVIAARILLISFEKIMQSKWGFSPEAGLREARDRLKDFIESYHYADHSGIVDPPDKRTLALRIIRDPSKPNLQIVLLGKVCADNMGEARRRALDFWMEVRSQFPTDYALKPMTDRYEFLSISKHESLLNGTKQGTCIELSRFEGLLQTEDVSLNAVGVWNSTPASNERIWRVLASSPEEVALNITLRPTMLYDDELQILAQITETADKAARESPNPLTRQDAELLHQLYQERLKNLGYAYLAQIHVIAPNGLSGYIPRAIGSALTHHRQEHSRQLGYQMRTPGNNDESSTWLADIHWLELHPTPGFIQDARMQRLRYLVGTAEASTLFQLPFPPKGGIPGVNFERDGD
jgi:hypothetical protein